MLTGTGRWGVNKHTADGKLRKMWAWMGQLEVVSGPERMVPADGGKPYYRWFYRCPIFDPVARVCTDHANRPPVCSNYPWYGREPESYKGLPPRCSFVADTKDAKMLPIVEVRHGAGSGSMAALAGRPGPDQLA